MRSTRLGLVVALAVASLATISVGPLGADNLADLIPNLFDQTIRLAPPPPGFPSHEAHFIDQGDRLRAAGTLLNDSLLSQISTFPIGSSAGGFTYTYDETLGVFNRSSESFGPIFAERAQTLGRGKWNAGLSYQQAEYDEIDGIDLDQGRLAFPLFHQDTNADGTTTALFFEGDVINATARLGVETQTTVVFFTYGFSDRLDFGVVVPIVAVDLDAEAVLSIDPLATGTRGIHRFIDGSTSQTFAASDSASGIGDLILRGKWRLGEAADSPWAVALDLRLPTGDDDDLLGTGATQAKPYFVWSGTYGTFAPHVNLGYTFTTGGESIPDELDYTLGFDWAAHARLTVAVDLVGRTLHDVQGVESRSRTVQFTTGTGEPVQTTQVDDLSFSTENLNLLLGSAGVRWNVSGSLLLTFNTIFSLSDDGLQDTDVIPFFGLDYSF